MPHVYCWMYVIVQPYAPQGPMGYVLHRGDILYNNIGECTTAALEWLQGADHNIGDFEDGPVLVIESFEQNTE